MLRSLTGTFLTRREVWAVSRVYVLPAAAPLSPTVYLSAWLFGVLALPSRFTVKVSAPLVPANEVGLAGAGAETGRAGTGGGLTTRAGGLAATGGLTTGAGGLPVGAGGLAVGTVGLTTGAGGFTACTGGLAAVAGAGLGAGFLMV